MSLNWTDQIVAWWKKIRVNCSLKFPSCSSFAVLLCMLPIGFTEITCGVRCYLMRVSESEKNIELFQQCFYWQPQLWSCGLAENWKFLPLRVLPMALRCNAGAMLWAYIYQRKGKLQDCPWTLSYINLRSRQDEFHSCRVKKIIDRFVQDSIHSHFLSWQRLLCQHETCWVIWWLLALILEHMLTFTGFPFMVGL